jgi:hypothetical protein
VFTQHFLIELRLGKGQNAAMINGLAVCLKNNKPLLFCPQHPNETLNGGGISDAKGPARIFYRCLHCRNSAEWNSENEMTQDLERLARE